MLVDVVFPGWVPFAYLAESQNIPGWLDAPAQALTYPFNTYVGDHLTRLGTRNDVLTQQEYIAELRAQAANAIATFNPATVYQAVDPTNPWAVFRGYLDGVAAQAASAVVPNWIDQLGGADVYTFANAYTMVESLRIDYGQLGGSHASRARPESGPAGWSPGAPDPPCPRTACHGGRSTTGAGQFCVALGAVGMIRSGWPR
jgi:hypothetical protein